MNTHQLRTCQRLARLWRRCGVECLPFEEFVRLKAIMRRDDISFNHAYRNELAALTADAEANERFIRAVDETRAEKRKDCEG